MGNETIIPESACCLESQVRNLMRHKHRVLESDQVSGILDQLGGVFFAAPLFYHLTQFGWGG